VVGLSATAALGMLLVGTLNLISVYFAVLFVGLGVDFGIQFSVRYRAERLVDRDLDAAIETTAHGLTGPLLLAAASIAAAFYSFLPTAYVGLSELGLIAGTGMIIAFATTVTLLPALLAILKPADEKAPIGFAALAPLDLFLERRRNWIVGLTLAAVILCLPLLKDLRFDFNPLNLRSKQVESVSTLLDLMRDPDTSPNTIDILEPDLARATDLAKTLDTLPENRPPPRPPPPAASAAGLPAPIAGGPWTGPPAPPRPTPAASLAKVRVTSISVFLGKALVRGM